MLARLGLRFPSETPAAHRVIAVLASALHEGLLAAASGVALATVYAARVALLAPLSYIVLSFVVLITMVSTHGPGSPAAFSRPISTLSIADLVPPGADLAALVYPAIVLAAVIVGLHAVASHPLRHRVLGDVVAPLSGEAHPHSADGLSGTTG